MSWEPSTFLRATVHGPVEAAGYTYRGLGMWMAHRASPKGRRPPTWFLIHLGTGLLIARIKGKVAVALVIGGEIADCSDWDFDGQDGWRNRDTELPMKVKTICGKYPKAIEFRAGHVVPNQDEIVRQIVMARA